MTAREPWSNSIPDIYIFWVLLAGSGPVFGTHILLSDRDAKDEWESGSGRQQLSDQGYRVRPLKKLGDHLGILA